LNLKKRPKKSLKYFGRTSNSHLNQNSTAYEGVVAFEI